MQTSQQQRNHSHANNMTEKEDLAAEIARIEREIQQRQQLELEIQQMEAMIAAAASADKKQPPEQALSKTPSLKLSLPQPSVRSSNRSVSQPRPPAAPTKAVDSAAEAARIKLEEEIRQMEEAIAAQARKAAAPVISPEEQARLKLEAEIRQMEEAIAAAAAASAAPPPEPVAPKRPTHPAAAALSGFSFQKKASTDESVSAGRESAGSYNATKSPTPPTPAAPVQAVPPPRPMNPLLAAISSAATQREKRIEENDGELYMQEVEPEVDVPDRGPQQMTTAMAEMIAKMATARDTRLAAGGEKKMTVIKEKEEYKKDFSSIVLEAANLGRLTRLNEHVVEAVAVEKAAAAEWKSSGLLSIQWQTNHMSVIHEAAQLGALSKMPEHVVSNDPADNNPDADLEDLFGNNDETTPRMRQLLVLDQQVGEGLKKVDKLLLGMKEGQKNNNMLIKPMQCYSTIEEVKLPKKKPPKIDPKKKREELERKLKANDALERPMLSISQDVATRAWERRARLDRPNSLPVVKEKCPCPFCGNPSPFQTFAYKEKERRHKEKGYESPDSDEEREKAKEAERLARQRERQEKRDALQRAEQERVRLMDEKIAAEKEERQAARAKARAERDAAQQAAADSTPASKQSRVPSTRAKTSPPAPLSPKKTIGISTETERTKDVNESNPSVIAATSPPPAASSCCTIL
jgi:hypothetical protein